MTELPRRPDVTDWHEHNGGPQPVGDDVWVEAYVALPENPNLSVHQARKATFVDWPNAGCYRILNKHLIDQLRDELETWKSVFPDLVPDRLKSDQQFTEEDVAVKIDAALKRGIELGLKAAAKVAAEKVEKRIGVPCPDGIKGCLAFHFRREYHDKSAFVITHEIRALNPDIIAKAAE